MAYYRWHFFLLFLGSRGVSSFPVKIGIYCSQALYYSENNTHKYILDRLTATLPHHKCEMTREIHVSYTITSLVQSIPWTHYRAHFPAQLSKYTQQLVKN